MNILVTGGAGFIGSHLCEKLIERGHFVVCYDNLYTGNKNNLNSILNNENFLFVEGNVLDGELLNKVIRENSIDAVFHYAAVVGVKRTFEKPLEVLHVNITGTKNVLEASKNNNVKKVIFASSSEVYGEPIFLPEKEDGYLNPKLPYAVSKLCGEKYCESYFQEYGLRTISLRLFNVYGPRQDSSSYGFVVAIFINRVLSNKPPEIYGDGSQTRDFTYIDDNIEPAIIALKNKKSDGMVINIGCGIPTTILNLAEMIIKISGKNLSPIFKPERNDIKHRFADITLMRKILGYTPKVSLDEGLKKTIEWYKKNR